MIIDREHILELLPTIPERPGCYLYRNREGRVLYVGKAKNLRKRINAYFHGSDSKERPNARAMLRLYSSVEYIVVETEHDALLLENNLIKEYKPDYNILLKEGNKYPYICIKNEPFPRVMLTYTIIKDGSSYYGPYPNRSLAWAIMQLFRRIYKFRTCSLDLSAAALSRKRYHVCLKYHIGRCKAPCVGLQEEQDYNADIIKAKRILDGNIKLVQQELSEEMERASNQLDFETAHQLQQTIGLMELYRGKSTITSDVIGEALVVACDSDEEAFYLNYLLLHDGNIIRGRTIEYRKRMDEPEGELLSNALLNLTEEIQQPIREIILPYEPEYGTPQGIAITIPKRGDRRRVLELSIDNVHQYMEDKYKQAEKLNPEQRNTKVLTELQRAVGLPTLPYHVECFDNSNIAGSDPVAACVVFKGGKPCKKEYRLFHIRGVETKDDYASMYEVVVRRYSRLREEGSPMPNLIITDGGRGHMSTVKEALREVGVEIPVLGLAKNDKHNTNEVLYGDPPEIIGIMQRGQVFHLLERIQQEVHRFAIEFHRKLRSKRQVESELDSVPGVGSATKQKLLSTFKSVKRIRAASLEELQQAIGNAKGKKVHQYFHPYPTTTSPTLEP